MIQQIITALKLVEIGKSETIDIAKGKYKLPETAKELGRTVKFIFKK